MENKKTVRLLHDAPNTAIVRDAASADVYVVTKQLPDEVSAVVSFNDFEVDSKHIVQTVDTAVLRAAVERAALTLDDAVEALLREGVVGDVPPEVVTSILLKRGVVAVLQPSQASVSVSKSVKKE